MDRAGDRVHAFWQILTQLNECIMHRGAAESARTGIAFVYERRTPIMHWANTAVFHSNRIPVILAPSPSLWSSLLLSRAAPFPFISVACFTSIDKGLRHWSPLTLVEDANSHWNTILLFSFTCFWWMCKCPLNLVNISSHIHKFTLTKMQYLLNWKFKLKIMSNCKLKKH